MAGDPIKRLNDATLAAIRIAGREWPRGLLAETPIPDAWMGLASKREGRRWFVAAGDFPRVADDDELTLIRNRAFAVPLEIRDATAACGNQVHAGAELLVRWEARESDLAAFRQALLNANELSVSQLASFVAGGGGLTSLGRFVRTHPAERLLTGDCRAELLDTFREGLKRLAFESGFVIERVTRFTCESPTFVRARQRQRETLQRLEEVKARDMIEKAALEAAGRRLGEISGLLAKLQASANLNGGSSWHALLPSLSPTERGRLLENLWRLTPNARVATAIAVVAGNECVWLDPARPDQVVRRVTLPDELGGLRSVCYCASSNGSHTGKQLHPAQSNDAWLLVGAASGVWMLNAGTGSVVNRFSTSTLQRPRTGFNAAVLADGRLYATHSQLGCWMWPLDNPAVGRAILAPSGGAPKAIRAVTTGPDGRVFFSADDCVHAFDPANDSLAVQTAADDVIHCMALDGRNLYVGTENGLLLRQELGRSDDWFVPFRGSGPLESAQVRRWGDLVELVVPAGPQGVDAVYEEQNVVVRLVESTQSIRKAWACDDLIVGLNDRRDRLVICRASQPDRQGVDVLIARMVSASVQDVCIVTGAVSPS